MLSANVSAAMLAKVESAVAEGSPNWTAAVWRTPGSFDELWCTLESQITVGLPERRVTSRSTVFLVA